MLGYMTATGCTGTSREKAPPLNSASALPLVGVPSGKKSRRGSPRSRSRSRCRALPLSLERASGVAMEPGTGCMARTMAARPGMAAGMRSATGEAPSSTGTSGSMKLLWLQTRTGASRARVRRPLPSMTKKPLKKSARRTKACIATRSVRLGQPSGLSVSASSLRPAVTPRAHAQANSMASAASGSRTGTRSSARSAKKARCANEPSRAPRCTKGLLREKSEASK
mmetsp:Transcript_2857/g.8685  ORF Transcript_2857/g.8685 Transcript_2857/m.8685 type:complete len:225 (+) Transcript_2857:287-961(+)